MLALSLSVTLHASLLFVGTPTQNATLPMNQGHATLQLNLVASLASTPEALKFPLAPEVLETPAPKAEALPKPVTKPTPMTAPVIEQVAATLPVMQEILEPLTPEIPTQVIPEVAPEVAPQTSPQITDITTPTPASVDANTDRQPQGVTTEVQLHDPIRPVYPLLSRRRGEEGTVTLEVRVTSKGQARVVMITQTSGFTRLDKAALKACRQARYLPAKHNGRCVDASFNFKVRFQLQNAS
ncbi:MAG: energy transducer TonB [Phycisphaeraceae bacterium]|nr:energy transducer TonB [Phycisphaeraceae bacterium]